MGSGKTLLLTAIGKCSTKIVSNFALKFPFIPFSVNDFIESKYDNCAILLDEAYNYMESRIAMDMRNRFMSYMLFQSRKKSVDIFTSVQLISTLDLRLRNLTDCFIYCNGLSVKGFEYDILNVALNKVVHLTLRMESALKLYELYDTNQIIEPPKTPNQSLAFKSYDEIKGKVESIANEIIEAYPKQKITHNQIKDYIFQNSYPSKLEQNVYARVKVKLKEV